MKASIFHCFSLGQSQWPWMDLKVERVHSDPQVEIEDRQGLAEDISALIGSQSQAKMDFLSALKKQGALQNLLGFELGSREESRLIWSLDGGFSRRIDFILELAHFLPHVAKDHKCHRLHGHSYQIGLQMKDQNNSDQLLKLARREISDDLDRRLLNEIKGLENPTAEILAAFLFKRLKPDLAGLETVYVHETQDSACSFSGGSTWSVFKAFELEAALPYQNSFLGRSLKIRLGIEKELDSELGWTLDFAQIKAWFRPIRHRLDHHNLGDIDGKDLSRLLDLGAWLFNQTEASMPDLRFIEIQDSVDSGMILERK